MSKSSRLKLRSSTNNERSIWLINPGSSLSWLVTCSRRVAFKRKVLEVTPNTTRANLYSTILGSAKFTSSTHRKRRTSLYSSLTAITRIAFLISATSAIGWTLNLVRISGMSEVRIGPVWRQSYNAGPFSLADALYTMRSLVVNLSSHDAVMGKVMWWLGWAFSDYSTLLMIPLSSQYLITRSYSSSCFGFWLSLFSKDRNLLWLRLRLLGSRSWASFHGRPASYLWFLKVIVFLNVFRTELSSCLIPIDSNSQKVRSFILSSISCECQSKVRVLLLNWLNEYLSEVHSRRDQIMSIQILCSLQQAHSLLFRPIYLQFYNTDLLQWECLRQDSLLKDIPTKQCPSNEHNSSL